MLVWFQRLSYAFVHLSLRGSLPSLSMLFLHLLEQNRRSLPSRRTKLIPVPGGIALRQKLHSCVWGMGVALPDLPGFPLGLPEQQDVVDPYGALHIP